MLIFKANYLYFCAWTHKYQLIGAFIFLLISLLPANATTTLPVPLLVTVVNQQNTKGHDRLLNPALDKGVLLIAGKNLNDPNFAKTIILITEYSNNGTVGLVLNRPTEIPVAEALPGITDFIPFLNYLYIGGPVATASVSLLLKSESPIEGTNQVTKDVYHINSRHLFKNLQLNKLDGQFIRIYAGFSGWSPGQLESELLRGDWYIWHAEINLIFNAEPDFLWDELIQKVTAKWVLR
jgi:putative transcriptional regulator